MRFPSICARSAMISRTQAATGSASMMFSIASRRLAREEGPPRQPEHATGKMPREQQHSTVIQSKQIA
jgi:hypothetical protein